MRNYPVVIHKDADSDYGVTVPDLPGCFSAGPTMDDALANAVEAIATHVEGLLLDGEAIPGPKEIETHQGNPDYSGGMWAVVAVDLSRVTFKGASGGRCSAYPTRITNAPSGTLARLFRVSCG